MPVWVELGHVPKRFIEYICLPSLYVIVVSVVSGSPFQFFMVLFFFVNC